MATIDNLELQISANTDSAIANLRRLAEALSSLKGVSGSNFEKIATGFTSLKRAITGIRNDTVTKVERLADAFERLSKADAGNLASSLRNFQKVQKQAEKASETASEATRDFKAPAIAYDNAYNYDASNLGSWREISSEVIQTNEKLKQGFGETESEFRTRANNIARDIRSLAGAPFRLLGSAFTGLGRMIKSTIAPLNGFIRSIARIALYRAIRGIIKAITSGIREGVQNLAMFSKQMNELDTHKANQVMSSYASNFLYLKNTIATAVIPILKQLEPIVASIINRIVDLTNVIAQFFSAFTGATTYTKAKYYWVDYADGLDKASGSASKLNKQLAQFDELNNLTTSSGSGSDTVKDYLEMFEDPVPIADWITKLKETIEKGDWKALGQSIADKIKTGLRNIDWDIEFAKAFNSGKGFASFLNGLIDPEAFKEVGKTISGAIMMGVNFAIGFSNEFEWEELGVSIGEGINGFFENFDGEKTAEAISKITHGLETAFRSAIKTVNWLEVFKDLGTLIGKVTIDNLDLILKAVAIVTVAKFAVSFTQGALNELSRQIGAIIASKVGIQLTGLNITSIGSGVGAGLISKLFAKGAGKAIGTGVGTGVLSGSSQFASALGGATTTGGAKAALTTVGGAIGKILVTAVGGYFAGNLIGILAGSIRKWTTGKSDWLEDYLEANPAYDTGFGDFLYKITFGNLEKNLKSKEDSLKEQLKLQEYIAQLAFEEEKSFINISKLDFKNLSSISSAIKNGESSALSVELAVEDIGKAIDRVDKEYILKFLSTEKFAKYRNDISSILSYANFLGIGTNMGNGVVKSFSEAMIKLRAALDDFMKHPFSSNAFHNLALAIMNTVNDAIAEVKSSPSMSGMPSYVPQTVIVGNSQNEYNRTNTTPVVTTITNKTTQSKIRVKNPHYPNATAQRQWELAHPQDKYEWYAKGGFPTVGSMFFAGEAGAELVGNINGRTGVANTDQIETAIYQASYDAMSKALSENQMSVTLEGDADKMFRVMQGKASAFSARTGRVAF